MKKFSIGYVKCSFLTSLFSAAFLLFVLSGYASDALETVNFAEAWPFIVMVYAILYVAQVIYARLYVATSGYELTDGEIKCQRGVLFKKAAVLPYANIHSVNKKQSLFQKWFGIAELKVDSGATGKAFAAEITILEDTAVVDRLMAEIKARQGGTPLPAEDAPAVCEVRENLYQFPSKLKVVYSLLSMCGAALAIVFIGGLAVTAVHLLSPLIHFVTEEGLGPVAFAAVLSLLALVVVSALSLVGSLLSAFVAYHNFQIQKTGDDIEISYGLFVRQTNTFKLSRVKAIKILRGPVKRLFGFVTVQIEVVGYGVETGSGKSDETENAGHGILFPLCGRKQVAAMLETILPGYAPSPIAHTSGSYGAFVLWGLVWAAVATGYSVAVSTVLLLLFSAPATAFTVSLWLHAVGWGIAAIVILIVGALQWNSAGLAILDNTLTLQNGGFIRRTTVINASNVVALENITTPCRQKRGIYTYKIHFFTNSQTNTVTVKNLNAGVATQLEALLRY